MTKYEWERELKKNIQRLPADEVSKILDYYDELFEDKSERGLSEKDIIREFGNPFDVAHRIINEFEGEFTSAEKADASNGGESYSSSRGDDNSGRRSESADNDAENGKTVRGFLETVGDKLNNVVGEIARQFKRSDKTAPPPQKPPEKTQPKNNDTPHYNDRRDSDTIYYRQKGNSPEYDAVYRGGYEKNSRAEAPEQKNETSKAAKTKNHSNVGLVLKLVFCIPLFIIFVSMWSVAFSILASGVACVVAGVASSIFSFFTIPMGAGQMVVSLGIGVAGLGAGLLLTVLGLKLMVWFARATRFLFTGRKGGHR